MKLNIGELFDNLIIGPYILGMYISNLLTGWIKDDAIGPILHNLLGFIIGTIILFLMIAIPVFLLMYF